MPLSPTGSNIRAEMEVIMEIGMQFNPFRIARRVPVFFFYLQVHHAAERE